MKRFIQLCLLAYIVVCCASCTSEYSLASGFLNKFERQKKDATEKIYVCLPKEVLHTNSSLNDIEDFSQLGERQQDSVISSLTAILNKVNDSIFLSQFNQSLLYNMSQSNIPIVLVPEESQLPVADSQHFVLNIVQLEAEEYLQKSLSDFSTRNGTYYKYYYDLRHFSTNVWLKFNAPDTTKNVYFKNYELADHFNGKVTKIKDGQATIKSHFDRIGINDAYYTARVLGAECAEIFIERLLTDHIKAKKGSNEYYYFYDPASNEIISSTSYEEGKQQGFQEVTQ